MKVEDPWQGITPPSGTAAVNGRPVEGGGPWDFYWMLDTNRRRLLGLRHSTEKAKPSGKLPKLRGIQVEDLPAGGDQSMLVFRLMDSGHKEIFRRLCLDIISSTSRVDQEQQALDSALVRTWHWHRLLKGGSDGRLTPDEQKGLIGEIHVLQELVAPRMPISDALESWTGPLGAPKDFEIGHVSIEAKARRGGAEPHIQISSEHQLDVEGLEHLYLHVISLARPGPEDEGFSIADAVTGLRDHIANRDPAALDLLEMRLSAVGFRDHDDYSDSLFIKTSHDLLEVTGEFPRVSAHELAPGVSNVRYSISLPQCEPFAVETSTLNESIGARIEER
jgi:hypothetical protein